VRWVERAAEQADPAQGRTGMPVSHRSDDGVDGPRWHGGAVYVAVSTADRARPKTP
jgi:hypothetical protein